MDREQHQRGGEQDHASPRDRGQYRHHEERQTPPAHTPQYRDNQTDGEELRAEGRLQTDERIRLVQAGAVCHRIGCVEVPHKQLGWHDPADDVAVVPAQQLKAELRHREAGQHCRHDRETVEQPREERRRRVSTQATTERRIGHHQQEQRRERVAIEAPGENDQRRADARRHSDQICLGTAHVGHQVTPREQHRGAAEDPGQHQRHLGGTDRDRQPLEEDLPEQQHGQQP